ncbi:hypothetical protein ABZS61_25635 [Streptomyces sp. NPDC005566]
MSEADATTVCAKCGGTIAVSPARHDQAARVRHVDAPGQPEKCPG